MRQKGELESILKITKKLHVMYVEDNDTTLNFTSQLFENFFEKIVIATDGHQGVELYQNNRDIDLIITDINMPYLDGISMIEEIREDGFRGDIIILSAYSNTEFFTKTIRLGVSGYMLKPLELDALIDVLKPLTEKIILKNENRDYQERLEERVEEEIEKTRIRDVMLSREARYASIGRMIDAIGHQWKQPISIINSYLDSTKYKFKNNIEINREDILNVCVKIENQLTFQIETLDEFRSFFRDDDVFEDVQLLQLFKSISILIQDSLAQEKIELDINIEKKTMIKTNIKQLQHVFINIIDNAKDAYKNCHKCDKSIKIRSTSDNLFVTVSIEDNAGGIDESHLVNLFNPDFTTKKATGGSGVGLYLAKQIVEKIGGSISVKNGERGAIFSIILPLA